MHVFTLGDLQIALDTVKERTATVAEKEKEGGDNEALGNYYKMVNKPHKAIGCYRKFLAVAKELGDREAVGRANSNLGIAYWSIGQYQMAIDCHKMDLKIAGELGDKTGVGRAHGNLGIVHEYIGQYQLAIENYKKHLKIAEELSDKAGVGIAYGNLGNAYQSIGQCQIAKDYHKEHLNIAVELGDKAGVGTACNNLGNAYNSIGLYQMAIECHKNQLQIAEQLGDEAGVGRAYGNLGSVYNNIGQYQMAIDCHKKDLEISEKLGDKAGTGIANANLGSAYYSISKYQMAIDHHEKHRCIAEELGDRAGVGVANENLGNDYRSIGRYQMAIGCHKIHLTIAEELGDEAGVGRAHGNLGIVHICIGQYQMAMECIKKDLEIASKKKHRSEARIGIAYSNLGHVCCSIGQYEWAISYHTHHLRIAEKLGNKAWVGRAHEDLGNAYERIGSYQEAIKCQKKNLEIAEELGDEAGVSRGRANLGNAYIGIGQYQMAIECYKKRLEIAENLGERAGVGRAHANLGLAYKGIGQYQMAIDCHRKHLEIAEELGDIRGRAHAQFKLGILHQRDSDDQACQLFAKSILSFHNIRRNAVYQDEFNTSMSNMFSVTQRCLFPSLLNLNQVKAALVVSDSGKANALYDLIKKYVESTSTLDDQQIGLFQKISDDPSSKTIEMFLDLFLSGINDFKQDGSIIFYSFDQWDRLHMWVVSRSGVYHEHWRTSNGLSTERYLISIVKKMRKSFSRAVREHCIPYPENYSRHGEVEKKQFEYWNVNPKREKECAYARDLEKRIRTIFTNGKPNHRLDCDRDLSVEKRRVREKYHLESPAQSYSSSCYLVGISKGTEPTERRVCDNYSLDIPDTNQRSSVESPEAGTQSSSECTDTDVYLEKLYSVLIAPIEEHLEGSKLLIVPDGPLFLLPFCALLSHEKGHLCQKYSLQFTAALQVLNASLLKPLVKLGPALFIGNPTLGKVDFRDQTLTLPPLPSATVEARECAKYFEAEQLLEKNATKGKVLNKMKEASIIHIAAHGHVEHADIFLAPNEGVPEPPSEEHYLLTAKDVLECHLKARLVVLSCCHSGRGEISNEGVVRIARSFLGAGARSVLVTLWQIPDEKTMEFMKLFYGDVCRGLSVCRALQKTMIELKKSFSVPEWTPFQIVGEDIALSKEEIYEIRRQSLMRTREDQ